MCIIAVSTVWQSPLPENGSRFVVGQSVQLGVSFAVGDMHACTIHTGIMCVPVSYTNGQPTITTHFVRYVNLDGRIRCEACKVLSYTPEYMLLLKCMYLW